MALRQFISKNGFYKNKSNPRTHTIMSGGCLYIAEELYDEFLGKYASEVGGGNRTLAYSELRSPDVFRMYFDVDILDDHSLGDEFLLRLSRSIQATITKFYTGVEQDTFKCVLCSTATKEVEISEMIPPPHNPIGLPHKKKEDEEKIKPEPERVVKKFTKNGYHILFPFLNVTLEKALQLRFSVVRDLERNFGKREVAVNPWADVIDKAPYYNGLKMCGSVKSVVCSECKGQKRKARSTDAVKAILHDIRKLRFKLYRRWDDPGFDYANVMSIEKDEFKNEDLAELYSRYQDETGFLMCFKCGDKGTHLEDRFYMPTSVLDYDGLVSQADLDFLNENMHEMMRWTSIRCRPSDEATGGYLIPHGYSSPVRDRATGSLQVAGSHLERLSPGIYREAINSEMFTNDALGLRLWKGKEILDEKTLQLITEQVRSFHSEYKGLDVRQVFEVRVTKTYTKSAMSTDTERQDHVKSKTSAVHQSLSQCSSKPKKKGSTSKALANIVMANGVTSATDRVLEMFSRVQVRVSGPGSRYCTNKGGEHTSNSVFFWISKDGISQKCFSRKDAVGVDGKTCKLFRSQLKTITPELRKRLFLEPNLFNMDKLNPDEVLTQPRGRSKKRRKTASHWDAMC